MKTAVQLHHAPHDPRGELLWAPAHAVVKGRLGPIALFSSGEIVAYVLRRPRRAKLFVFRTLVVDDRLAARLPGVHPRVRLLVAFRSAVRLRHVRRLFSQLVKEGRSPSQLSDAFYARVSVALGGRLPTYAALFSLIPRSNGVTS